MTLALSTRNLGRRPFDAERLLARMREANIREAFVSDAVPRPTAESIVAVLKPAGARAVAIEVRFTAEHDGEAPPTLLSPNRDVVAAASRIVRGAASYAKTVGAPLVVIHLGEHALDRRKERDAELRARLATTGIDDETTRIARALASDLDRRLEGDLDRACRNLFALAKAEPEIRFAVATPDSFAGFPNHRALGLLLSELRTVGIGYWHDVGIAAQHERVGLAPANGFAGNHSAFIVGAALHDLAGSEIHLPPGSGELDFRAIRDALPDAAERVLEVDARFAAREVALAVSFLGSTGY
jgi:sugar phosphate isomerase/epimerase